MSTRPRILLVAHHANPALTSEPLIGWRWARALDERVELTLITHIRNRDAIEQAGGLLGNVLYVDTERIAARINRVNDRLFPNSGSVNRLLLETLAQRAFDRAAVRLARGLVERGEIDLIHRVSPISPRYPSGLGKLGVPLVLGPVNGGLSMPRGFSGVAAQERQGLLALRRCARVLDPGNSTLRQAGAILVANQTTRQALPRSQRERAVTMCENAVDIDAYTPRYEGSGGPLRLLFLGRLLPYKGVQFALQALVRARSQGVAVRLDVIGDGSYRAQLESMARSLELEDRVQFHGWVPHEDVPQWLAQCDALVLPSVRESGGSVVLEAMAAGKPVLVADHGGPTETVPFEAGYRLPCPDPETLVASLGEALVALGSNEAQRERMGRAARRHVEREYTWAAKAERAVGLYAKLVERAEAPSSKRSGSEQPARFDGIDVSPLGFAETLEQLASWSVGDRFRRVATANVDFLTLARKDPELRRALRSADHVTADGQPLVWLSRLRGAGITERVAGSDLLFPLLERAARLGASVYFLGASPEVLARVRELLAERLPELRIAGSYEGRVELEDESATRRVAERVRESGADLLLVALGCPKQDLFLERYGESTGARLGIGVGASLDFLAGERRRAPRWLQSLGLEWLFRMLQEPRRLTGRYLRDARYLGSLLLG